MGGGEVSTGSPAIQPIILFQAKTLLNFNALSSLTVYSPFIEFTIWLCTFFLKVNNGKEVSFEALGLIRESDFLLC